MVKCSRILHHTAMRVAIALGLSLLGCDSALPLQPAPRDASTPSGDAAEAASDASQDARWDANSMDAGGEDARSEDAGSDASRADASVDAGLPAVRYVGRFDTSNANGPRAGYPASRAIVRFEGSQLDVTMSQAMGNGPGPSYFDVVVDGTVQAAPFSVAAANTTVTVASGLPFGPHTVELVKRTEAEHGVVQFNAFAYPGGGRLLAPPAARTRHIEVIGNSAIDGFGLEGTGPTSCSGDTSPQLSNATKSVAVLAADAVNAHST
jgi:Carbohydrate esterase 2 N-terminal